MDLSYNLTDATFSIGKPKYTIEDILTLVGGYDYFSEEQIHYVYHKTQGNEEMASHYLALCQEHAGKMQEKAERMKEEQDIKPLEVADVKEELTNEMVFQ